MKVDKTSPIVIIGAGSIGERHIQVLLSLGYTNIHVYCVGNLPFRQVDPSTVKIFRELEQIDQIKPVVAFIASPTSYHLEQALFCVKKGIHVLVEKPLSHTLQHLQELKELILSKNVLIHIGYMLRYHPAFIRLKAIIQNKEFGELISFHTHWGEYLPDWHPWEDYKQSYASQKVLGGGVALTLSHDIDIANWLLNEYPSKCKSLASKSKKLDIEVEAVTDFICTYPSNVNGHIHLDFSQKIPFRTYNFVFDDAFIQFNYFDNQMIIQRANDKSIIDYVDFERNDMYRDQTKSFFDTINFNHGLAAISEKNISDSEIIIDTCVNLDVVI